MSELKPCPFCGSKAEIEENSNIYSKAFRVKCTNIYQCAIKQDQWNLKEKSIESWNRRVNDD